MIKVRQQHNALYYGAAAICLLSPSWAMAQAEAAAEAASSDGGTIQDIVVTAQRRSERLQDVPVAVTAVNAARLEAIGIQNGAALANVTPGLTYPQNAGFGQPHIRGVGSNANGPGLEQPIATYVDGVYIASAPASLLTLNNIERVEVLKGPQGTLFGRNATGGLIQIITRDPEQELSGQFHIGYGNYEDITADAYVTGGLTSNLAMDVALRYEYQGTGYGHNLGTGNEIGKLNHDFGGRTKFLWAPSDETKVKLAFDYESTSTSRDAQKLNSQYPGTFDNALFGGPFPKGGVHDTSSTFDQIFRLKSGGVSGQIVQSLGPVQLQSITAYRESTFSYPVDADGTPVPILQINPLRATSNQFSQELQLSSQGDGRLKWVTGLYYFHSSDKYDPGHIVFGPTPISPVPNTPVDIVVNDRSRTDSYAGYAQVSYEILDNAHLTLGGRYTSETKKIDGTQAFFVAGNLASLTPIITPASGLPTEVTFRRFTYRAALDYKLNRDTMVYVSYNTGFKSGGFNLGTQNNPPYAPELLDALEGGIKAEMFDRHLRVNISAFDYRYSNIQVGRYVFGNIFLYNGAKAHSYGADAEIEVAPVEGLTLTGGFSYLHARFTSFPNADFITANPNIPAPNLAGVQSGDATGYRLPFSPSTTLNLGANYRVQTPLGKMTFDANYYRSGRFFGAPDNVLYQDAYGVADLALTLNVKDSGLSIKGYVKNVGNTVYRTQLVEGTQGGVVSFGASRTYGVVLGYKY